LFELILGSRHSAVVIDRYVNLDMTFHSGINYNMLARQAVLKEIRREVS
jgi:hypothetical protein